MNCDCDSHGRPRGTESAAMGKIVIGEFIIWRDPKGFIWIAKQGGESMQTSQDALETVIAEFWMANF